MCTNCNCQINPYGGKKCYSWWRKDAEKMPVMIMLIAQLLQVSHFNNIGSTHIDWHQAYKIALDTAQLIFYRLS